MAQAAAGLGLLCLLLGAGRVAGQPIASAPKATAAAGASEDPVLREALRDSLRLEIQRYNEMIQALRDSLAGQGREPGEDERWLLEIEAAVSSLGEAIGEITDQLSAMEIEIDAGRFSLRDGQGGRVTVALPPDLGDRISQGIASITRVILDEVPDTVRIGDRQASHIWQWHDRATERARTPPPPERLIRGDIVKFNDDIEITAGEVVDGDVVAIRGDVRVAGRVRGDLVAILGDVELGDGAEVDGKVVTILGSFRRGQDARVGGLTTIAPGDGLLWHRFAQPWATWPIFLAWQALFLLVLGLVLLVLAATPRRRVDAVAAVLHRRAGGSLLLGTILVVLGHAAVIGLCALLVLTVIGIPVAALTLLGLALLDVAAIGVTSLGLGQRLCGVLGLNCQRVLRATTLGLLALHLPALLAALAGVAGLPAAFVMLLVWVSRALKFAALAAGLGALLLSRFGAHGLTTDPAVPLSLAPGTVDH